MKLARLRNLAKVQVEYSMSFDSKKKKVNSELLLCVRRESST